MKIYVLDASAWVRLFTGDGPLSEEIKRSIAEVQSGLSALIAPDLIIVEAAQAIHRKRLRNAINIEEAKSLWRDMNRVPLEYYSPAAYIDRAFELAMQHGCTVYDSLYLALAEAKGASLLSVDELLIRAMGKMGIT